MSGGVPAGWALVPVEPTTEMTEAGEDVVTYPADDFIRNRADSVWSAMLAATPTPPSRDADGEWVEMLARIIDPAAFFGFDSLEAYCIRSGDTPEEAKATAEWAHAKEIEKARDKARAALQALGERP